jgi:hypothetical protein
MARATVVVDLGRGRPGMPGLLQWGRQVPFGLETRDGAGDFSWRTHGMNVCVDGVQTNP